MNQQNSHNAVADAERIAGLRQRCLDRKKRSGWMYPGYQPVLTAKSLRASEKVASWKIRCGLRTRDRLSGIRFVVDELETMIGRLVPMKETATTAEISEAEAWLKTLPPVGGQTGHCELDVSGLFEVGIDGLRDDLGARLKTAQDKPAEVYQSFIYALDGFSLMIEHAAETARLSLKKAGEARGKELEQMARCCECIAHKPPKTFREALQLLWFADLAVMIGEQVGLVGPGHMDRTVWPFYRVDRDRGLLTREQALAWMEELYILINEFIPDGLAIPVMVGGRDVHGGDVTNDLSYLCLEALRRTKLVYPTVGVCWHEGTPSALVDLAIDLIGKGYPTPAFFGDETIQKGLKALRVPPEDACHYLNSTCVEITPASASNVWVASPYFNTCRILLEEIEAEVQGHSSTTDFASFFSCVVSPETVHACLANSRVAASFEELCERYQRLLAVFIHAAVQDLLQVRQGRREWGGKPLQSVLTRSCIERGRDIDDGGALYNWIECSFVGLANLADSLCVIREEVYRHKRMTMAELHAVLKSDFEGQEQLRVRFLQGSPKYGNGHPEPDALVAEMVRFAVQECSKYSFEEPNSPFVPGAFCWVMHEAFGRITGATPDGRRTGTTFADGAGPAQGRESRGPTAAILSTTSWNHSPMIGGIAYNMKFNTSLFTSEASFGRLKDLVLTYLRRGGFETQINVVDHETLKKARANPEQYRDLVVRIGGYTDYFTRLSPQMQDEVMLRTEFGHF